jgi:hypothetical protein
MVTLYAPQVRSLLSQGYRQEMPGAFIPVPEPGEEAVVNPVDDRLNVNLATLDELVALEGVGITIARRVQEVQGSIESIEDLIEVSNRPDWLELAPSLRFD